MWAVTPTRLCWDILDRKEIMRRIIGARGFRYQVRCVAGACSHTTCRDRRSGRRPILALGSNLVFLRQRQQLAADKRPRLRPLYAVYTFAASW